MSLVNPYIGIPKCQDCGWKLHTDITDNCSCMGENTPERELKHKEAFNMARGIQFMNNELPDIEKPDPETIKALIELGCKPAEPSSDPVIVETPTNVLKLSEVPEQADGTEDGLVNDDPSVSLETPQPVPEEFPLTVDCGVIPWSKIPIAEISPLVWFNYIKFEGTDSTVFNVSDGNGRALFHCCEEEVASFVVRALNVFVQAAYQTQV